MTAHPGENSEKTKEILKFTPQADPWQRHSLQQSITTVNNNNKKPKQEHETENPGEGGRL